MRQGSHNIGAWRVVAVLAVLAAAGCETTQSTPAPVAAARPVPTGGGGPGDSPEAIFNDACAVRLQNLCGPLLEYYARHQQLPARLEDLRNDAEDTVKLEFTCPVSGLPYVYVPQGLVALGAAKRIIAYDAQPVHNGKRYCILWLPPRPGTAPWAEVLLVPEGVFHSYLPVGN